MPGGGRAVTLNGLHRAELGAAHTDPQGNLRVEVMERPDEEPPRVQTRELETEYRATVEEILELRGDDGRISAFVRAIREMGTLADTVAYAPDLDFDQKIELLETVDVVERLKLALKLQRERLAELQVRKPHPRGRRGGRRQAAARVRAAQADGVDPQGARRGRRVRRRGLPHEDRRGRHAGRGPRAGRARGRAARADGRPERRSRR